MKVFILLGIFCALLYSVDAKQKLNPPVFPEAFEAEIEQCWILGPPPDNDDESTSKSSTSKSKSSSSSSSSEEYCEWHFAYLSYDYPNQRAKIEWDFSEDDDEDLEGTLLFRWDLKYAYSLDGDDECTIFPLTEEMPVLRVPQNAIYAGHFYFDDDEETEHFVYNETGFFVMDYFVTFGDSDEPALPFSTVQVGGMFGDFYCNFTDVEPDEPKDKEFEIPDECKSFGATVSRVPFSKSALIPYPLVARGKLNLSLGCITPLSGDDKTTQHKKDFDLWTTFRMNIVMNNN